MKIYLFLFIFENCWREKSIPNFQYTLPIKPNLVTRYSGGPSSRHTVAPQCHSYFIVVEEIVNRLKQKERKRKIHTKLSLCSPYYKPNRVTKYNGGPIFSTYGSATISQLLHSCWRGREPFETLFKIWLARGLNSIPSAQETRSLSTRP